MKSSEDRKVEIRKEMTRRLQDQEPEVREKKSLKIQEKLLSSEEFKACRTVMTYVSLATEVDTKRIHKEAFILGKRVAVPYIGPDKKNIIASEITATDNLEKGPFGIYQPKEDLLEEIALEEIELVIVPAIAFSKNNMRLGRGKGYYDRFLAKDELSRASKIGLAFSFQIIDSLPHDPHDIPVSRVITD